MLRKLLLIGVTGAIGYAVGVRAGFDAAVRDWLQNDARLIQRTAARKSKFDYGGAAEEEVESEELTEKHSRKSDAFQ